MTAARYRLIVVAFATAAALLWHQDTLSRAAAAPEHSANRPTDSQPADAAPSLTSQPASQPSPEPPFEAPAVQPAAPVQVLSDFIAAVQAHHDYPQKAREFVARSSTENPGESASDFINSALAVCSSDFADALKAMEDERHADAAERFEKLAGAQDAEPFLAVNAANLAATSLVELEQFPRALTLLESTIGRYAPVDRYTPAADHMLFMLGYSYIRELHYEAARAVLTSLLQNYPNAPQRLRVTATQIVTEIDRRIPGKLGDVRDLLAYAQHRIQLGETGQPVMERQEEAVALLERMIKDSEENEKNARQKSPSGGGKPDKPQPSSGTKESRIPSGAQAGDTTLRRTRAAPGDAWGQMPPREREQIIQTLQKQFPSQYRDLLEQYYRQLAKEQPPS